MRASASSCDSVCVTVSPALASISMYCSTGRASARHETQPANDRSSASRRVGSSATSVMPTRPPGFSTRAISAAAVFLSGNVQKAHSHTTASTDASGNGMRSASPR
jgi:hypothetical protein